MLFDFIVTLENNNKEICQVTADNEQEAWEVYSNEINEDEIELDYGCRIKVVECYCVGSSFDEKIFSIEDK